MSSKSYHDILNNGINRLTDKSMPVNGHGLLFKPMSVSEVGNELPWWSLPTLKAFLVETGTSIVN